MNRKLLLAAAVVVCVCIALVVGLKGSGSKEKVSLAPKLRPGGPIRWISSQDAVFRDRIGDVKTKRREQSSAIGDRTVLEVDPQGVALMSMKYTHVVYDYECGKERLEYDSAKNPGPPPAKAAALAALVGREFSMRIDPHGRIIELLGADVMVNDMIASLTIPEGQERDEAIAAIRYRFDKEMLKGWLDEIIDIYPDGPVAVGDSWSRSRWANTMVSVSSESTYTLSKRKHKQATITFKTRTKIQPGSKPYEVGAMKLMYKLAGDGEGQVVLDEETGQVLNHEQEMTYSGNVMISMRRGGAEQTYNAQTTIWDRQWSKRISAESGTK